MISESKPEHLRRSVQLSWSSFSTYLECGERHRLERGIGLKPSHTYYATLGGSALHYTTEDIDREHIATGLWMPSWEASARYLDHFHREIEQARQKGTQPLPSGLVKDEITDQGGPNKCDQEWWEDRGPVFLERWVTWRQRNEWEVATLKDGTKAIEVPFEVDLGEGLRIVGLVDRIFSTDSGSLIIDIKGGKKMPDGYMQLATYALGLQGLLDEEPMWAAFWSPRSGRSNESKEVGRVVGMEAVGSISKGAIADMYRSFHRAISEDVFLPNVTGFCRNGCSVRDYCWAGMGLDSRLAPRNLPQISYDPRDNGVDLTLDITEEEEDEGDGSD